VTWIGTPLELTRSSQRYRPYISASSTVFSARIFLMFSIICDSRVTALWEAVPADDFSCPALRLLHAVCLQAELQNRLFLIVVEPTRRNRLLYRLSAKRFLHSQQAAVLSCFIAIMAAPHHLRAIRGFGDAAAVWIDSVACCQRFHRVVADRGAFVESRLRSSIRRRFLDPIEPSNSARL
jgi:hypothetical protein